MVSGIIPECRSDSSRIQRSASSESPPNETKSPNMVNAGSITSESGLDSDGRALGRILKPAWSAHQQESFREPCSRYEEL
jgi:hypothetical protein